MLINQLQSFINDVSDMVRTDNSLGLSPSQKDQIDQILSIIKNIISDGIQRGDISKLVHLLGEVAEHIPELGDEVKEIVKDLKKLEKKLFESDDQFLSLDKIKNNTGQLGMESDLAALQEIGESGTIAETDLVNNSSDELLKESTEEFKDIAINIGNMFNNFLVLKTENFDGVEKMLKKMNNLANLTVPKSTAGASNETRETDKFDESKVNPIDQFEQRISNDPNQSNSFGIGNNNTFSAGA